MKRFTLLILSLFLFFFLPFQALAIEDPLSKANNKFGIHILFVTELDEAARLVNSSGGDWGYVTIPIQVGDRDLIKWQQFMNHARELHLIPILRLATEGDYFNTKVWRKPEYADINDFANFLDSLDWPVKNRYVIVFNEVNRGDEWGGQANPTEYASLLSYAAAVFKSKNQDFFIISAGLDNAAPDQDTTYISEYSYLRQMDQAIPGIFNQVDGIASHSYPNPGFSSPPSAVTSRSISSFSFESDLITSLSTKKLPIFITETGWSSQTVPDNLRSVYYKDAFTHYWSDPRIVAVTPFLLRAGGEQFGMFGFINATGNQTGQYKTYADLPKVKGMPQVNKPSLQAVLGTLSMTALPVKYFKPSKDTSDTANRPILSRLMKDYIKWMLRI